MKRNAPHASRAGLRKRPPEAVTADPYGPLKNGLTTGSGREAGTHWPTCVQAAPLSASVHARPQSDALIGSPFGSPGSRTRSLLTGLGLLPLGLLELPLPTVEDAQRRPLPWCLRQREVPFTTVPSHGLPVALVRAPHFCRAPATASASPQMRLTASRWRVGAPSLPPQAGGPRRAKREALCMFQEGCAHLLPSAARPGARQGSGTSPACFGRSQCTATAGSPARPCRTLKAPMWCGDTAAWGIRPAQIRVSRTLAAGRRDARRIIPRRPEAINSRRTVERQSRVCPGRGVQVADNSN